MNPRFSKFVIDALKFCESSYRRIYIAFVDRINLFQYEVWFIPLKRKEEVTL